MEGEREEPEPLGRRIGTLRLDERCFDDSVGEITKVHVHCYHKHRTIIIISRDMYHKHPIYNNIIM